MILKKDVSQEQTVPSRSINTLLKVPFSLISQLLLVNHGPRHKFTDQSEEKLLRFFDLLFSCFPALLVKNVNKSTVFRRLLDLFRLSKQR